MKSKGLIHLRVKVVAGARTEVVKKVKNKQFLIQIREKAERGQANKRVLEILQREFPGKRVVLVKGHLSPNKIFAIDQEENAIIDW